jgi:hypothetical protein
MALPNYPPTSPGPSPTVKTMERGQLNYFFTNAQATATQPAVSGYGNALGAPASITMFGVPPTRSNESTGADFVVQIDCYGSTAGAGPNATVAFLGSLDGVQFYTLSTASVTTQGTLVFLSKTVTPEIKVRFITAAITAYSGAGGAIDSVTAGVYA